MLCDDCKKRDAVYHSVRKINGTEYERHLCAECQSKSSAQVLSMLDGFGLSELSGLLASFPSMFSVPARQEREQDRVCSGCGVHFSEFLNSGFLGCDRCYSEFSGILFEVIQKVQGAGFHKGKTPSGSAGAKTDSKEEEYNRLSHELAKAIEAEKYEEAAVIRDRMRTIKESEM